jgi:predicted transcriptional regulator
MPDGSSGSGHVSLRVPQEVIDAFDKIAAAAERPRSWAMVRALRQYLENEGAEILEDAESIAELDRGERQPFEDTLKKVREVVADARARSVRKE